MPEDWQTAVDKRGLQFIRAYSEVNGERALMDEPPGSPIPFVASTPGVKRDGLDLRAAGWRTDRYRMNPAVLWCHDHRQPPIGTATAEVLSDRLRMAVSFDQEDPFAVTVESKVRRGIMRACSVGWNFVDEDGQTINDRRVTLEDLRDKAFYDLTELSIVPVGADPLALSLARRAALRSLSRELAAIYDDQERPDSDVTGDQLRAAVHDELVRLGFDPNRAPLGEPGELLVAESPVARIDENALAAAIRAAFTDLNLAIDHRAIAKIAKGDEPPAGVREPNPDPVPNPEDSAARAAVDYDAAQAVLAAFNIEGETR